MRPHTISFVASLILLLAAGCGSDTDSAGGPGGTSGSGGSGGAGGGGDPCAGLACGDACDACPDGTCMPQACNAEGQCVEAQLAACGACPAALPKKGDACDVVGLVCDINADIRLSCRLRATCGATGWEPLDPGCMSFPADDPKCPDAQPSGACDVMTDAKLCVYGEPFCGCTECAGGGPCGGKGEWVCALPPSPPCPPIAPKLGSPCTEDKLACVYGACALGTAGGRTCEGGVWTEDIVNCPL